VVQMEQGAHQVALDLLAVVELVVQQGPVEPLAQVAQVVQVVQQEQAELAV